MHEDQGNTPYRAAGAPTRVVAPRDTCQGFSNPKHKPNYVLTTTPLLGTILTTLKQIFSHFSTPPSSARSA